MDDMLIFDARRSGARGGKFRGKTSCSSPSMSMSSKFHSLASPQDDGSWP